jgi:hypothetical protein
MEGEMDVATLTVAQRAATLLHRLEEQGQIDQCGMVLDAPQQHGPHTLAQTQLIAQFQAQFGAVWNRDVALGFIDEAERQVQIAHSCGQAARNRSRSPHNNGHHRDDHNGGNYISISRDVGNIELDETDYNPEHDFVECDRGSDSNRDGGDRWAWITLPEGDVAGQAEVVTQGEGDVSSNRGGSNHGSSDHGGSAHGSSDHGSSYHGEEGEDYIEWLQTRTTVELLDAINYQTRRMRNTDRAWLIDQAVLELRLRV